MPDAAPSRHPPLDAKSVLNWYDHNARVLPWRISPADRRRGVAPDPYRVWLSEIMLQQTTVAAVAGYFARFTARWPEVKALAAAPLEDVLAEWAGLGYYARARNLHACAQVVTLERGGAFPETSAELRTLPGIGLYTASAIAAICHDEPVAVIDGNVDRVMARYLALDLPVRDAKPQIRDAVQQSVPDRSGDFAQAMMDLGATICARRAALCDRCPLQPDCAGAASGKPLAFPVKPAKARRPVRYGHAFIMRRPDGAVWLRQRPEKGLLAKMTETPGTDWVLEKQNPAYPVAGKWTFASEIVHVFTHFRLELDVWLLETGEAPVGEGWWSTPGAQVGEALPSLFRKVLATVEG
jgi:A/G-specific adenine glycosylase